MTNVKKVFLSLTLFASLMATNSQVLAHGDWYANEDAVWHEDSFYDNGWFVEEEELCDNECGYDNEAVITAPTCKRYGDFYAYRQGNCSGCQVNLRKWNSTDQMEKYIPEGSTIRVESGIDVYIVKYKNGKMFKRLVLSPSVFENYGHLRWEDVMNVSPDVSDAYTTSDLVTSEETGKVYRLYPSGDCGIKRRIEEDGCFWNRIDWDSVYLINGFDERSYTTASSLK